MILLADPDETKIQMTPKILKAKKIATSISRKISYMIKKSILKKMNKLDTKAEMKFTIMVYGITLLVEFRKILNLHPADGEFEYKNTRKIIE
jgi:hypothetical protein